MPRNRSYSGSVATDPYAAARENLAERRFAETAQNDQDRLSLSQESNLLHKAQMVFQIIKARQAIEDKREQTLAAGRIIQGMGNLDINSPTYEKDRAQILSDNAAGIALAADYTKQKDSVWSAQKKADINKAETTAKAVQAYSAAAKNFAAVSTGSEDELQKPLLLRAQRASTAEAIKTLRDAPAATAALQSASAPQQPAGQPQATQPGTAAPPAPSAPPAVIATDDATKFLTSIGVGTPAPQPAAQPVEAAASGLPDAADDAASGSSDDEE